MHFTFASYRVRIHARVRKIVGMASSRFTVESVIRGYHVFKSIWLNPVMEEELSCEREIGNTQDTHAVAMRKTIDGEVKTVIHIPCLISSICSIIIRRGGVITCKIQGPCQYSLDLPQGGLRSHVL